MQFPALRRASLPAESTRGTSAVLWATTSGGTEWPNRGPANSVSWSHPGTVSTSLPKMICHDDEMVQECMKGGRAGLAVNEVT